MRKELPAAAKAGTGVVEPAEVVWRGESRTELRVRIERDSGTYRARPALGGDEVPDVGDRVLIAADSHGELWIIAAIAPVEAQAGHDQSEIREAGGASAAVEAGKRGQRIVVRDRAGAMVFEYEPETRTTTLHTPDGDLELAVPEGALSFRAARGVSIHAGDAVDLNGAQGVGLRSGCTDGGAETRIDLRPERLGVVTRSADVAAGEVRLDASHVVSRVEKAVAIYGTLELTASRIRQRARRILTAVQDLFHVAAGRVEADVNDNLRLRSGTATVKARGRVKIDGDSIHLG